MIVAITSKKVIIRKIVMMSFLFLNLLFFSCQSNTKNDKNELITSNTEEIQVVEYMDSIIYFSKIDCLANGDTTGCWTNRTQPPPRKGAILPNKRIVAYYGNLYSKRMGILGEVSKEEVYRRLNKELKAWEEADTNTTVIPALHYIAVVAQASAGKDGKYRMRMPTSQIDKVLEMSEMWNEALVFLDIQVGLSSLQEEIPLLEKYLKMPNVHLGIDPEFSMKKGKLPGEAIGSFDDDDINYCIEYLSDLVKKYNLPPKVLVVHRFTETMVENYKDITLSPELQIVVNMDGWGAPANKIATYKLLVYKEPVQFAGFKIFYKNDTLSPPHKLLTPKLLLELKPQPIYIQYQ